MIVFSQSLRRLPKQLPGPNTAGPTGTVDKLRRQQRPPQDRLRIKSIHRGRPSQQLCPSPHLSPLPTYLSSLVLSRLTADTDYQPPSIATPLRTLDRLQVRRSHKRQTRLASTTNPAATCPEEATSHSPERNQLKHSTSAPESAIKGAFLTAPVMTL